MKLLPLLFLLAAGCCPRVENNYTARDHWNHVARRWHNLWHPPAHPQFQYNTAWHPQGEAGRLEIYQLEIEEDGQP